MEDRGEIEGTERKKETLLTEANQIEETERKDLKPSMSQKEEILFERKKKDRWKENTLDWAMGRNY